MQIQGSITITIDEVAIQQAQIANKALFRGLTGGAKAGMAAVQDEDYAQVWRLCRKHGQALQYSHAELDAKKPGTWHCTFNIRPQTREEKAA